LANDAKSNDKVMTRPPTTAVNRTLFLRHSATRNGAERCETAKLVEPIQTEKINKCNKLNEYAVKNKRAIQIEIVDRGKHVNLMAQPKRCPKMPKTVKK
jgi:hypothetical protein